MFIQQVLSLLLAFAIAFLLGKAMQRIKMPAILGWLIAGMITGPYALQILSVEVMSQNWYHTLVEVLESFVGIMIGSELVWRTMKKSGKEILTIALFEAFVTFIVVSLAFAVLLYFIQWPLYLAFIFGAIALATAPAPSLSIVSEYRTKGPVTNTLLPIVALDDLLAITVFFVVMVATVQIVSGEVIRLYLIAFFMLFPLLLGGGFAILFAWLHRLFVKGNKQYGLILFIVVLLAANGVGLFINHYLLDRPILNFMLLGIAFAATVVNVVEEQIAHEILHDFRPFLGIGLIIVILNLGAPLDYRLIAGAGWLTLLYITMRAVGKITGSYLGAKIGKAPRVVQQYLGLTLLPHSGVSLIFTGIAVGVLSATNPEGAAMIQGTIAAAAVLNEFIAVILAKKAFVWAGEIAVTPESS